MNALYGSVFGIALNQFVAQPAPVGCKWTTMIEIIFKISLLFIILAYLIWRFLYSPNFTNLARQRFIVESLATRSFEELKKNQSQRIKVKGRTGYAHWISHENHDGRGLIVEFDVHPSKFPISLSASEFIHIRNSEHLEQIKKELQRSDDYSSFLAGDEEIKNALS